MVTCSEIEYFFETYISNYSNSLSLEEQIMEPVASKNEWIAHIKRLSRSQQNLCQENDLLIHDYFHMLDTNLDQLGRAQYDLILKYCRKLYYSTYNEPVFLLKCVDALTPFYAKIHDIDSLLFLYICGGFSSMQLSRTGDHEMGRLSVSYYQKVIEYQDDIEQFLLPVSRDYIFIAYDNLIRVEPCLHNMSMDDAYALWQNLCALRSDPKFCQYDKSNPRIPLLYNKTLTDFISSDIFSVVDQLDISESLHKSFAEMTFAEYQRQLDSTGSIYQCSPPVVFNCFRLMAEQGMMSWNKAFRTIDDYYFKKCETIEDDSELDSLRFYVDLVICLIDILAHTTLSHKQKKLLYEKYRNHMTEFLVRARHQTDLFSLANGLHFSTLHPHILSTFDNGAERINYIIDMVVSSHLSTLTHSVMMSYLAEAILKRIFKYQPQLLIPPDGSFTKEDILKQEDPISDYTIQACLLHDIGKNSIIPIINTQHRKLTDYEFSLIQMHPQRGAQFLSSNPSLVVFHDIALGHHKSYDGQRGYPLSFDNVHSKFRAVIDLIHICDCLDAATDYLSRNYHRAKSFETVMQELVTGKGTDYNPYFVDLILEHPDLYRELSTLTEVKRENIYYDVYLTYVNKRK